MRARCVEEKDLLAAEKAAFKAMQESWLLKIFFLDDGNNIILFSTQVYIETISDMEKYFLILLGQLIGGVKRFHGHFQQIWQEMQEK